jgi:hypothetical protein
MAMLLAGCGGNPAVKPTEAAPYPSTTREPASAPASADVTAAQPFHKGEYTWQNGVTMRTTVIKVEPWGERSDFCGDGSCGVADPDDTRFVLRYEVTVPKTLPGPLDVSGCPGDLHVESGNDDEAFSDVLGDDYRAIGDKIIPGNTKFGVAEYYVEKAYIGQAFYLESACGDPTYAEVATFRGLIKR